MPIRVDPPPHEIMGATHAIRNRVKIDQKCRQTIIQGVLQSSQPIKICCISYNSEARTRTLQGILETQNYPCSFDCPYKALIGNHPVMKKFRGTILNFHKSQNILKEFFFSFFWQPLEGLSIKLN